MEEQKFLSLATTLSELLIISILWMFLKSILLLTIPCPKSCHQYLSPGSCCSLCPLLVHSPHCFQGHLPKMQTDRVIPQHKTFQWFLLVYTVKAKLLCTVNIV